MSGACKLVEGAGLYGLRLRSYFVTFFEPLGDTIDIRDP